MTTYDDSLTLAVSLLKTTVGNLIMTRPVSSQLVASQSTGGIMPYVINTLVPEQVIKGVLPKISSTLVFTHDIETNIKMAGVSTQLVFSQDIDCNIKNGTIETVLVPIQTISTSSSILSDAEQQELIAEFGLEITDGGAFGLGVTTTLAPSHTVAGYCVPYVTLDGERYVSKAVFGDSYLEGILSESFLTIITENGFVILLETFAENMLFENNNIFLLENGTPLEIDWYTLSTLVSLESGETLSLESGDLLEL